MSETSTWPAGLPVFKLDRQPKIVPRSEAVQMESGRTRNRRNYLVAVETIDVTWTFIADQYETFEEYFNTELENGELPFEVLTYTPSEYPGVVVEVIREYAFLDSQYLFSRRDNEFEVTATLLVTGEVSSHLIGNPLGGGEGVGPGGWPEPELVFSQNSCGDILSFTWTALGGISSYSLESSSDGVTGWVVFKGDISGSASSITLNNPFDVERHWKLVATSVESTLGTSVLHTAAATTVALCEVELTGCTLLPDGSVSGIPWRSVQRNPVSILENPRVAYDSTYLWVSARYDYYIGDPNEGGPATTIDVTCPTPDATIFWTTDGSDPVLDGPSSQYIPSQYQFGGVIKARAYKDGCYGPMKVILVDRTINLFGECSTIGVSGAVAGGGSCTHIYYNAVSGDCVGPFSSQAGDCWFAGTGLDGLEAAAIGICLLPSIAAWSDCRILGGTHSVTGGSDGNGADTIDGGSIEAGGGGPGIDTCGDYQAPPVTAEASTFQASELLFTRISWWDSQRSDLTEVRAYVVGAFGAYRRVQGFSGPGGDPTRLAEYLQTDMVIQQAAICGNATPVACFKFSGFHILEPAFIILTRDDDSMIAQGFLPYP